MEEKKNEQSKKKRGQFLEILSNQECALDLEYLLPKFEALERKCYIEGEIDEGLGTEILKRIQFWNSQDEYDERLIKERKPIQIYINSCGGDVTSALQIADAIKNSKTPVYTIVTGEASSAGVLISSSGIKRYGFSNSSYMLHDGSCSCEELEAHNFLKYATHYKKELNRIEDMIVLNTKISHRLYQSKIKEDWYFFSEEAVVYGIIDEIITDVNGGIFL